MLSFCEQLIRLSNRKRLPISIRNRLISTESAEALLLGTDREIDWRAGVVAIAATLGLVLSKSNGKDQPAYAAPRRIQEIYNIIEKPIGEGTFGHVCAGVHHETKEVVAIKKIPKKHTSLLKVLEEVDILRVAGEMKSVPNFQQFFIGQDHYYIVMEMAKGGELFDFLVTKGLYTEKEATKFMMAVAECLACLHEQGIVHFDIKPENIMLANDTSKENILLTDFGSSFKLDSGPRKGRQNSGTVAYSPPEVLRGDYCDGKADVFALGIIMYIVLAGVHPFDPYNDADDDEVKERILADDYSFEHPAWDQVSPEAMNLIAQMLEQDPKKRLSAAEVINHPWFRSEHSTEALDISASNLRKFWLGRRRLKACLLAVMTGLVDGVPEYWASANPQDRHQQIVPGSRRTSLRFMDQGQKGYITPDDIENLLKKMGTSFTKNDIDFMMRSSDGNLQSHAKRVSYDTLMNLVPPICPAQVYKKGDAIYKKGDLDDNFFLIKSGEIDLRVVDMNKQQVFRSLKRGQYFGEAELLTPSSLVPRINSAYCNSDVCEVLSLCEELFALLIDPELLPEISSQLNNRAQEKVDDFLKASIRMSLPNKSRELKAGEIVWEQSSRKDQVTIVDAGRLEIQYTNGSKREIGPDEYMVLRTKNRTKKQNIQKVVALEDAKVTDTNASLFFERLERHNVKTAKHFFSLRRDDQTM